MDGGGSIAASPLPLPLPDDDRIVSRSNGQRSLCRRKATREIHIAESQNMFGRFAVTFSKTLLPALSSDLTSG